MQTSPHTKPPRKLRDAHPSTLGNLIDLVNGRIAAANDFAWRYLPIPEDTAITVVPARDGQPSYIETEHGALQFRFVMRPEFEPRKYKATIYPPILRNIDPALVLRVQWRYRKGVA